MVLRLYGFPTSPYTRFAAFVCKEKEIPYEFVNVGPPKGENKASGQIHPFGQVPYIDDDGFILYESRAIARYLIKKYPNQGTPGLIPSDIKEEALSEQASSVEVSHFSSQATPIVMEKLIKLRRGGQTDQAKVDEHLRTLEEKLDVYETILDKQQFLAGNNVTIADLQHLPVGSLLSVAIPGVLEKRPNVARWWKDIYNRPAWQAVQDGP